MYDCSCLQAPFAYKFTGKERDSESDLDNFGARYECPKSGACGEGFLLRCAAIREQETFAIGILPGVSS
jgi:hypothetical protein